MHRFLLIGLLFTFSTANGQIEEVRRITETLCSPEFHGRGYVNKGDSIAAAFLSSEFHKIGVAPYKDSYSQSFELNVNTFPAKMELLQDGVKLIPGIHFVVDPSSGPSPDYHRAKSFEPYLITGTDLLDEEIFVAKMTEMSQIGSTTIIFDLTDVSGDTLRQLSSIPASFAKDIPVMQIVDKKFTWSVGREQLKYPLVYIQDSIVNRSGTFDMHIDAEFIESYKTQNIIAYIPAKKKCSKTVVFTAHYDHLGRMGTNTYFPGANDNASGTAMLLTMANYFKENSAEFNIMFIAFAGEEAGLVGSKYFVEHPPIPLKKIKFLVNLDIMGSGEEGVTVVNATLFEKQFKLLEEINQEKALLAKVKRRGPAANSDHYWFTEKGVPAFFIYTMGPNKHYHDVFDKYSELSFNEYDDITTLLIEFVKRLK
jgi:hypothetical protein